MKEPKPTARQYFYERVIPRVVERADTIVASLERIARIQLGGANDSSDLKYSNVAHLDNIVAALVELNSHWLEPNFFKDLFVGVAPNVGEPLALNRSNQYTGKLVLYDSAMLTATYVMGMGSIQFSKWFRQLHRGKGRSPIVNTSSSRETKAMWTAVSHTIAWFRMWKKHHVETPAIGEILFEEFFKQGVWATGGDEAELDRIRSAEAFSAAQRFILAHEIAHHIIGHTQHTSLLSEAYNSKWAEKLLNESKDTLPLTEAIAHELQADSFAYGLLFRWTHPDTDREYLIETWVGVFLALVTVGLWDDPLSADGEPSSALRARLSGAAGIIATYTKGRAELHEIITHALNEMIEFLRLAAIVRDKAESHSDS